LNVADRQIDAHRLLRLQDHLQAPRAVILTTKEIAMDLIITIAPIHTRPGYYTARCDGRLLCRSRQPFLDGARALLDAGYSTDTTVVMRSAGSTADRLRSTIGAAAKLAVETNAEGKPVFRQWRGPQTRGAAPPIASGGTPWMEAAE
jgi:hypothetical protein